MENQTSSYKDYFYIVYYALFFNLVACAHYWFMFKLQDILRINFLVSNESELTQINYQQTQYYSMGLIISGLIWPQITKYISTKKALLISCVFQGLSFIPLGMFENPIVIPITFLFKGIMSNIYSAGIAFVYTFCSKENLRFQFTSLVIISIIFLKALGLAGSKLYNLTGQSFFAVNCIVAGVILAFGTGFLFLYKDVEMTQKEQAK
jgi:hypothetical protein